MPKNLLIVFFLFLTWVSDVRGQSLLTDGFTDVKSQSPVDGKNSSRLDTGLVIPMPQENFDAILSAVSEFKNEGKITEEEYDRFCSDLTECTFKDPFYRPLKPVNGVSAEGLPDFEITDVSGNRMKTSAIFSGKKVTMLNVWDTTCAACITEMPQLKVMQSEYEEKGGQVIGLVYNAVDEELIGEAKDIIADLDLNYLNLLPTDEIRSQFYSQSFPVTYFIDENGKVLGEPIFGAQLNKYRARMTELLGNRN